MDDLIAYDKIKGDYPNSWLIPYEILLRTIEWRGLREQVLKRDQHVCQICKKAATENSHGEYWRKPTAEEIAESEKEETFDLLGDGTNIIKMRGARVTGVAVDQPTILHLHHLYYIYPKAPWDYPADALMTVCHACHAVIHATQHIPVYLEGPTRKELQLTPCIRCNGTAFLDQYHYVRQGICFRCEGRKYEDLPSVL